MNRKRWILIGLCFVTMAARGAEERTVVGWRNDGTGVWPSCGTLPRSFDFKTGENVRWTAALPKPKGSAPLVIGGKVVVLCEPDTLVCFDAITGKRLWTVEGGIYDSLGPEKKAQVLDLWSKLHAFDADPQKLGRQSGDYNALHGELTGYGGFKDHYPAPGYLCTPTPLSDGQRIYVHFSSGPMAAFDMDGKRLWLIDAAGTNYVRVSANQARLFDGKLVYYPGFYCNVRALDPATGKEIWKFNTPTKHKAKTRGHAGLGSPVLVKIGNKPYIMTDACDLVDLQTGTLVATDLGRMDGPGTPTVIGDMAVFEICAPKGAKGPSFKAVRFAMAADKVQATDVWVVENVGHLGNPIIRDGLIWFASEETHPITIELATGKRVDQPDPKWRRFTSLDLQLADGMLIGGAAGGGLVFMEPAKEPKVLFKGSLPYALDAPSFANGCIYYSAVGQLICLGSGPKTRQ